MSPEEKLSRAEDLIAYHQARFEAAYARLSRQFLALEQIRVEIARATRRAEKACRQIEEDDGGE